MYIRKGAVYITLLYVTIVVDIILIGIPKWGRYGKILTKSSTGKVACGLLDTRVYFGLWEICCIPVITDEINCDEVNFREQLV